MSGLVEFVRGTGPEILEATYEHVYLTFVAMAVASLIALPLGIYLTRTGWPKLASTVMGAAGVIQTVPTLAMVALIVTLLVLVKLRLEVEWIPAIGPFPGIVALVLYALLPILRNTYTGIRQVDPAIIEVARGMGMTPRQVLFKVELPLSLPVIMAGLRIAMVWTIGVATLCGLIGAGGLGELIIRGLRNVRKWELLLAGIIPSMALALIMDWVLGRLERWLTPAGLRSPGSPSA